MKASALDLALRKQRLQIASESLRIEFGKHAAGLAPVFTAGDFAVAGTRWVRRNPQILVATGVALLVVRPKSVWRLARRAFFTWQAWRQLDRFLVRHRQTLR